MAVGIQPTPVEGDRNHDLSWDHAMAIPARALPLFAVLCAAFLGLLLLPPAPADAAMGRIEGTGSFHTSVDVINRWRGEDRLDVIVLVEVVNGDLRYGETDQGLVGRMRIEVELESLDGWILRETRTLRTKAMPPDQAGSRTEFQVFGVLLEDVPFRSGRVRCHVFDILKSDVNPFDRPESSRNRSDSQGLWEAPERPRPTAGLALEDPLFLAHAPLMAWRPGTGYEGGGLLQDYAHPARRYGLEQEKLQIYMPIWPQAGGVTDAAGDLGLRVQVTSLDMEFALNDTVEFDAVGKAALAAGLPASLIYELDVNLLPEGTFLLNLAPLDARGRGVLSEFDVVWRIEALARNHRQLLGEGRTVFHGAAKREFLRKSPAEQEVMLKEFWDGVNPSPDSLLNEAYLEFQYRLAFVRRFLGGFGPYGAEDERGEVFLALGMPDEVRTEHMPANFRDQDDARIRVFEQYAPVREGASAKSNSGSDQTSPYGPGGIPMSWSSRAEQARQVRQHSSSHLNAFEFWKYEMGGYPLYESRFSSASMGQRFLFVDRTGSGEYSIESSNVIQGEE